MDAERKWVEWDRDSPLFREEYLWQFGEGPFEVLEEWDVTGHVGYLGDIAFPSKPGKRYLIATPDSTWAKAYPNLDYKRATFHQNFFRTVEDKTDDDV